MPRNIYAYLLRLCTALYIRVMTSIIAADMATQKQPGKWSAADVAALRKKYDMTYQVMADELGMSTYVPVWRWANGKSVPSRMAREKLDKLQRDLERREKRKKKNPS